MIGQDTTTWGVLQYALFAIGVLMMFLWTYVADPLLAPSDVFATIWTAVVLMFLLAIVLFSTHVTAAVVVLCLLAFILFT